jgi:hypothetical protein
MEQFALYYDAGVVNQSGELAKDGHRSGYSDSHVRLVRHAARCRQHPSAGHDTVR